MVSGLLKDFPCCAVVIPRFADSISSVSMSNDNKLLAAGANNGRVML